MSSTVWNEGYFTDATYTLSPAQRRHQLLQTRFVLLKHAPDVPLKVNTAGGEATLQESVYRALGRKNPPEWAQHAWQIIESQGQRLLKDAKTLETPEENLAELNQQAADFAVKNLPVLKALQVA